MSKIASNRIMYAAINKAAKPLMNYSQIFGTTPSRERIISIIQKNPLKEMLVLLSQICAATDREKDQLKNSYLEFCGKFYGINTNKNKDELLFMPQATLFTFKWLIAYGIDSTVIRQSDLVLPFKQYNITDLHLQISDFLPKEIDLKNFLVQVLFFTKDDNIGNLLARSFFIFTNLATQEELYEPNEFLDFNTDFKEKYGYTIEEYLAVIFSLKTLTSRQKTTLNEYWIKDRTKFFRNTNLKTIGPKIINDISIFPEDIKKWALDTIDDSWDYLYFLEFPLLKLNENEFIPINDYVLTNGLFYGLYHRIRHCYPTTDSRFQTFFGRPFEKYIDIILENAVRQAQLNYEYIPEFDFGNKSVELSSDAYIKLDNKLIIIEAKGAMPTINTVIKASEESIKRDIKKLFTNPIIQANSAYKKILDTKFAYKFSGVDEVYIISVTIDRFPQEPTIYQEIEASLVDKLHPTVKGYFNFNIDDLEALCYLMSRKGKKPPVFRYLENKLKNKEIQSFSWFLSHSSIPVKRNKWVEDRLLESYEKIFCMAHNNPEEALKTIRTLFNR